jgi:O-antigen/teichoic acid export membrane protein
VALGTLASQACVYVLNIVATRTLGPPAYGELASLLTLTVIMSIPAMALQSWTARTTALGADARSLMPTTLGLSILSSVATFAIVFSAAPLLDTEALPAAASAALLVLPLVWLSTAQGLLQGSERLVSLGAIILLSGAGRLGGGLGGLALGLGPWAAVWGIGLSTVVVAGVAWAAALAHAPTSRRRASYWPVLRITLATGAMWTLANIDVLLARITLDPHGSGWYAAGALVTRAVQFAPQFVVLSVFAALTDSERSLAVLRVATAKVAAIGLAATVGMLALGPWLVPKVLGPRFAEVGGTAWLFALLGTLLAVNQLLVAQRVARHDEVVAVGVWATVGVLCSVVALRPAGEVLTLVTVVVALNAMLGAGLVARLLTRP